MNREIPDSNRELSLRRQMLERDCDPALLVDAIAFRLDAGDLPPKTLVRAGSQKDFGRGSP